MGVEAGSSGGPPMGAGDGVGGGGGGGYIRREVFLPLRHVYVFPNGAGLSLCRPHSLSVRPLSWKQSPGERGHSGAAGTAVCCGFLPVSHVSQISLGTRAILQEPPPPPPPPPGPSQVIPSSCVLVIFPNITRNLSSSFPLQWSG